MKLRRFFIDKYQVGDAAAFEAVDQERLTLDRQRQYATMKPQGDAWTARRRETGEPVACMGIFQEKPGGDFRAWAIASHGLSLGAWGELFIIARHILGGSPASKIYATAADEQQGECLERVGFYACDNGPFLRPYVMLK